MRELTSTVVTVLLFGGAINLLTASNVHAGVYDLTVDRVTIDIDGELKPGIGYNGVSPGPTLRFKEGEEVTINVTNNLDEPTSIHWHGLLVPYRMDGVPGISFPGIEPGETFSYSFPIRQTGTYWFHSHSGLQEPDGAFGSIVIAPKDPEPFSYERDYVVQLTDEHPDSGDLILRNLKLAPDHYQRHDTMPSGVPAPGGMAAMAADIEDVQGFTPMINGKTPAQNWTGLFTPGQRVRLRLINSSSMAYFDIRIPGLKMNVVQADGNDVDPVEIDELRIAVAETYDVIVAPAEDRAYTIFAESMGRSAFARGTLAPRAGMAAEVPEMRAPPHLTMADMGMSAGIGRPIMPETGKAIMQGMDAPSKQSMEQPTMQGMGQSAMHGTMGEAMPGMSHGKTTAATDDPFYAPGSGLAPTAANGGRMLSYTDLVARVPLYTDREPNREVVLRLTGSMENYSWSIDGIKYKDAEPIRLKYGEQVRFTFVNETMMSHPMHLHGMWSILDTGKGARDPAKHVVNVAPGATVAMETEVDAPGEWAFHCHLAYHMAAGMFRKVIVEGGPGTATPG